MSTPDRPAYGPPKLLDIAPREPGRAGLGLCMNGSAASSAGAPVDCVDGASADPVCDTGAAALIACDAGAGAAVACGGGSDAG